ncbi:MAG: glycosyltransferase [Lautropia sp.]
MRVVHVIEALRGGPASYLSEVLPAQVREFGRANVTLVLPAAQRDELPGHAQLDATLYRDGRSRFWRIPRLAWAVHRHLRRHPADIVHAQGTLAGLAVRLVARFRTRAPTVIYCAHGWAFDRGSGPWVRATVAWAERILAGWADAIVCVSDHDLRSAHRVGIPRGRLVRIVNAIADRPPASPPGVSWPAGRRRFLFVGRFDRQKGLDHFLHAMRELDAGAFAYAVGGFAVDAPRPVAFPANVQGTGWLPRDEVQRYIASADVLVMPSRWEGFGLTALEAMRAGKPVIASRVGGLPEIVVDGVTGRLVAVDDRPGLTAAMASMSDEAVRRMGEAARARFLTAFPVDRMNRSLLALYRRHHPA